VYTFQQLERGIQIFQRNEEARRLRELGEKPLTNVHTFSKV
jgi:hypothetical protein